MGFVSLATNLSSTMSVVKYGLHAVRMYCSPCVEGPKTQADTDSLFVHCWHCSEKTIAHDDQRVSNRPAYTPEHKSAWDDSYTNTLTPIVTLPAACTELQTTFSVGLEPPPKKVPEKGPTVRKHRVAMFAQARVRTRGGVCCPINDTSYKRLLCPGGQIVERTLRSRRPLWPFAVHSCRKFRKLEGAQKESTYRTP